MPARKREKTCLGRQRSKSYLDVHFDHHISGEVGGRGREARNSAEKRQESWGLQYLGLWRVLHQVHLKKGDKKWFRLKMTKILWQ